MTQTVIGAITDNKTFAIDWKYLIAHSIENEAKGKILNICEQSRLQIFLSQQS